MRNDDRVYRDGITDSIEETDAGTAASGTDQSPDQIEREIVRTRERMSGNIDALGEKLSPENLKRQAQDVMAEKAHEVVANVEERARQTGDRLVEFIRDNPLPVAAVSIGALWLFTQRNRSEISGDRMARFAYTGPERRSMSMGGGKKLRRLVERTADARDNISEAASGLGERAGELVGQAQRRAEELGDGAADRLHSLTDSAREQTERARGSLDRLIDENPLVVAAGAMILGAAIGMLLPETEPERRLMGSARDTVVDRAQEIAVGVKEAAIEAGSEVKEAVQDQVAERGPELKNLVKDAAGVVGEQVKDSVGRVTKEAERAARGTSDSTTA